MTEENQATTAEAPQTQFSLQRIYLKDLSFESPRAPNVFQGAWKPNINLELNTRHAELEENLYEVVLNLTITAKNDGDEVAFLAEVQQAGIFHIRGLEDAALQQTLGSFCPNILFPYARETVDNLVGKGSFPILMLAPVNFDAIYAETLKRRAEMEKTENPTH
ncbi:MAG: protein-export chaperone SecB [Gammaproteobacteria bacterium]|nr:protein-export chaperone SecB [Gammaproteobacteria bacterium]